MAWYMVVAWQRELYQKHWPFVFLTGQGEGLNSAVMIVLKKCLESEYSAMAITNSSSVLIEVHAQIPFFPSVCQLSDVDSFVKQDAKVLLKTQQQNQHPIRHVLSKAYVCPCTEGMTVSQLFSFLDHVNVLAPRDGDSK